MSKTSTIISENESDPGYSLGVSADESIHSNEREGKEIEEELQKESENILHPLENISDADLIKLVADIEREYRHLKVENKILYDYGVSHDPFLMEGVDTLITSFMKSAEELGTVSSTSGIRSHNLSIAKRGAKSATFLTITSILSSSARATMINLTQKSEMVLNAIEACQSSLHSFLKKSHITKRYVRGELEQFIYNERELRDAISSFENNICINGVEKITGRIPAEKFVKYMNDWIKHATLILEKLRLRAQYLGAQKTILCATVVRKKELRENVTPSDFEKYTIENANFKQKLAVKHETFLSLKRINAAASTVLNTYKKYLLKQQKQYKELITLIDEKEHGIEIIEDDCAYADDQIWEAMNKFDYYSDLKKKYKVPSVLEYANVKRELGYIMEGIKKWQRKNEIQKLGFNSCIRRLQEVTGSSKVHEYLMKCSEKGEAEADEISWLYMPKP